MTEYSRIINDILGGPDSTIGRNFTIKKIPLEEIQTSLISSIDQLHLQKFGMARWLDKTPGHEMIQALPYLVEYFDDCKIVFLKRCGIDNVASRERRFPNVSFDEHCAMWDRAASSWLGMNEKVLKSSISIEQTDIANHPEKVADALIRFLELDISKKDQFLGLLQTNTEKTGSTDGPSEYYTLDSVDWTTTKKATFVRHCYHSMLALNYPLFENQQSLRASVQVTNANNWTSVSENLTAQQIIHPNAGNSSQISVNFRFRLPSAAKEIEIQAYTLNKMLSHEAKIPLTFRISAGTMDSRTVKASLSHAEPLSTIVGLVDEGKNEETEITVSFETGNDFDHVYKACLVKFNIK